MIELKPGDFARAFPLCEALPFIPLRSTLLGNTPGRVFVDEYTIPQVAIVWMQWGFTYLAGQPVHEQLMADIVNQIIPELISESSLRTQELLLFPCSESWTSNLSSSLAAYRPKKIFRRAFSFIPNSFSDHYGWLDRLPSGFHIYRIDQPLIERLGSQVSQEITSSWASTEDFLNRGFGFCLLHKDEIVSLCTSSFIAGREVEACIRTTLHYRSKGYATFTALAFIEHCLQNDLLPHWECPWDHLASCALATRLGFVNPVDHLVYHLPAPAR